MATDIEKRISTRHSIEGPITLHTTIGTSKGFDAHLLNFSEQGLCFSTNTKLNPGTTILFKASNVCHLFVEDDAHYQLRSISMVTVKWCHESLQKDQLFYIVGANYVMPF